MNAITIIVALVALALGALIGWLFASREAAGAKETVQSLRTQLDEVVRERDINREAVTRLAALEASQLEREKGFETRIKELVEAKEALSVQFAEISNKLLVEAQETFLKRADQRFRQSEESAGQNLKALLQPVHERLERYETTVQKVEAERRDAFGLLTGQIEAMRTGTERVSAEAAKLVNALRNAPKARGRWGEQQLRNVLETCGLSEQDRIAHRSLQDSYLGPNSPKDMFGHRCRVQLSPIPFRLEDASHSNDNRHWHPTTRHQ